MPREHEYTVPASRPSSPPAPGQPASDSAQPAEQELPNTPNLAEPILHPQLVGPGSPRTRSANLDFEIRGFSCHRHRRSPKKPHATNFTKQAYQTNPIPTSSDNALAHATGGPPPPLPPKTQPSQIRQTGVPNRPNSQKPIQTHISRPPAPDRIEDLPRGRGNRKSPVARSRF